MEKRDKTAFSVVSLAEASDAAEEKAFWQRQTPQQRLLALEQLRQIMYGNNASSARLQRVLTVIKRP